MSANDQILDLRAQVIELRGEVAQLRERAPTVVDGASPAPQSKLSRVQSWARRLKDTASRK
jgi:hypothetical protein